MAPSVFFPNTKRCNLLNIYKLNITNEANYILISNSTEVKFYTDFQKLHFFKEFETMSNNNHKLWKTINNLLPSKLSNSSGPKVIKVGNVKVDNPTDIANHFNEFFCKIGQSLADKVNRAGNENPIKYLNNRINESIFLTPTNFQEISRIISSLKNSSSFGPDGISSFFFKNSF